MRPPTSALGPPSTAAAPFGPSETEGAITTSTAAPLWRQVLAFLGPGLLVSVGYMDPGNWATDIQAGSGFGYALLSVVAASSLAAIALQVLSLRLGLATRRDLARLCRERYPPAIGFGLWVLAEIAIVACDIAEVLGSALAFRLLLHIPLAGGVLLTGLDTLLVLGLKGRGLRHLEAVVLGLVLTIMACFAAELVISGADWPAVARGLIPTGALITNHAMLYIAVGILGATVMPHNLYLHSSLVQTRRLDGEGDTTGRAIRLSTLDTVSALGLALVVNAAILILAGRLFHRPGTMGVAGIEDAYKLIAPLTGSAAAAVLFGVGLFASGQSSTFTGTVAGQVILEGFLDLKIPSWQRRLITRALAILPALAGVLMLGEHSVGPMLVATQVVLSAQLPFAIWPLVRMTGDRRLMGRHVSPWWLSALAYALFAVITVANVWLVATSFPGVG